VTGPNLLTKRYEVRGTRYYKGRLAFDRGDLINNSPLRLTHQPNNKHDPNAVAIYLRKTGEMVGHIPRDHAALIRNLLDIRRIAGVSAKNLNPSGEHLYLDCDIEITSSLKQSPAWIKALTVQNVPGVYAITCTATGYVYIGESGHIKSRIQEHLEQLDILSHHNSPLQCCHDRYAIEDVWCFDILEMIEDENKRKLRETEIIEEFLAGGKDLFNRTPDGKGVSSHPLKQKPRKAVTTTSISDRKRIEDLIDELENEQYERNLRAQANVPPRKAGCFSVLLCMVLIIVLFWNL
jgi:hypothetical protein